MFPISNYSPRCPQHTLRVFLIWRSTSCIQGMAAFYEIWFDSPPARIEIDSIRFENFRLILFEILLGGFDLIRFDWKNSDSHNWVQSATAFRKACLSLATLGTLCSYIDNMVVEREQSVHCTRRVAVNPDYSQLKPYKAIVCSLQRKRQHGITKQFCW